MRTSLVTPYIFAALAVILGANAGLVETLGAHPFWAIHVAWIGVPIGIVIAIAAKLIGLGWLFRVLIFLACTVAAYAIAVAAKDRFTASFAEDVMAGRLWYLGWIATCAFATTLISAVFSPTRTQSTA